MPVIVLKMMLGLKKLKFRTVTVLRTSVTLGTKIVGDAMTSRNFIVQCRLFEEHFVNLNFRCEQIYVVRKFIVRVENIGAFCGPRNVVRANSRNGKGRLLFLTTFPFYFSSLFE